jgi:hypothetical protein
MYSEVPKIREQLKKKLPKLIGANDTLSVIWFSGRREFKTILEAEPVATLKDLAGVENAINKLCSLGLTGFKEPLEEAAQVIDRIAKKNPGSAFSLFFMSDGFDNQWSRGEILKAVETVAGKVSSATIVEYGYYADRPLLTQMAEKSGGTLIFAEDFDRYQPTFEAAMKKKSVGAKKIEVEIPVDTIGGFAYALVEGDLVTFSIEGTTAKVPEGLTEIAYLAPKAPSFKGSTCEDLAPLIKKVATAGEAHPEILGTAYAAISLYATRMRSDVVLSLLKCIGDVQYIDQFANCFGKQKYSEFTEFTKGAAFSETVRFKKGYDPNKIPREDAFTVLDMLYLLQSDEEARVLLDSPSFKYAKIGRGRLDASDRLTDEESEELQKLTTEMAATKDATKIKELTTKIAALTAAKKEALKFEYDPAPDGYAIQNLTFNEDRPNVSFLVKRPGTVDLSSRLSEAPKAEAGKQAIPARFPSFVFRNYAAIKDGLVNIDLLPVKVSSATHQKLLDMVKDGLLPQEVFGGTQVVDNEHKLLLNLKAIPVINRKSVKSVSAKAFFETQYALTKAQASQKVYNAYVKELLPPKVSTGLAFVYGAAAAEWLKAQGLSDGGYQPPKTVVEEAKDFYMGKELKVSLKGLSSLPSLKDAKEKMAKVAADKTGKATLNAPVKLMKDTIDEVEAFLASKVYQGSADKLKVLEAWLDGQVKSAKAECRKYIFDIAQTTFCIIVGQTWPVEFDSLDKNSMDITVGGETIGCKMEMREVEVRL